MSIAQIREQIDELSYEERVELSEWLQMTTPVEDEDDQAYQDEILALAEKRDAEINAGTKKLLSEEEFWSRVHEFKASLQ